MGTKETLYSIKVCGVYNIKSLIGLCEDASLSLDVT